MSWFNTIANFFKPIADVVDNLHTSEEEKMVLRNQLAQIEAQVATKLMELQMKALEATSQVAIAEQQHGNFLSKTWRPITSYIFVGIILAMCMGKIEYRDEVVNMGMIFLGVYAGGRSLEIKAKK